MNLRERFHEVMRFNKDVHSIKWEFGYWGETVKNWYRDGLPQEDPPYPDPEIRTPTSSLYSAAWTCDGAGALPNGIAVMAGGLYWPTQGFPLDSDVRKALGMDACQRTVDVNLLFHPMFEVEVIEDAPAHLVYRDIDGGVRKFLKDEATIPSGLEWPIQDKASWERIKAERLNTDDIRGRFPHDWPELVQKYKNRDYPLALGGYPLGLFGTPSHTIGYARLFEWYCEQHDLVHDIMKTLTDVWLAVFEEVLAEVDVDHFHFWEDISFGKGSMAPLDMVREYMVPYYKRIIQFLKARGVEIILLDTDGDCNDLIPVYLEAGVTGMYPFETHCGMDIVKVRKEYPDLQILGGIPKSGIAEGRDRIDEILKPVEQVLRTGGFVPFGDHFIPPDVGWDDFKYYRTQLNGMIERYGV